MAVDCSLNGADIPDPGEGSHSFIVKATDQAGNEFQIYFIVTLQLPPIAIHAIASSTATTSALITWSTNNLSTSVVHYGTSSSYGSTTSLGATARNSHSVGIGGLLPSTLYYFQIQSTDQHGHSTSTVGLSFITKDIASSSGPGPEPDPGSDSGLSSTRPSGMQDGVGYNLGFRSYPTLTPEEIQRIFGLYLSAQATSAIPVSAAPAAAGTSSSAPLIYEFKRDLRVGLTGNDVKALQVFLNSNGYSVSASGVGSAGNETSYFGQATRAALARLQSSNGIRPAVGYFGQVTRAFVNGLMGIGR